MSALEPAATSAPSSAGAAMAAPWRLAARRFRRNRLAMIGAAVLVLLFGACFGALPWALGSAPPAPKAQTAPATAPAGSLPTETTSARNASATSAPAPTATAAETPAATAPTAHLARYELQNLDEIKKPPHWADASSPLPEAYWMGTDGNGRDLRPRFLLGGVISLTIGILSALIAALIGTSVGLIAGYAGGRTDAILMRIVDVLYGLPYILLVILMRVALVPIVLNWLEQKDAKGAPQWIAADVANQWANFLVLLVGIGAVSWLTLARVVRGQVLSLRQQPYVEAARAMGFRGPRILARHILPNLIGTIIVYATLTVPAAVLSESFLSFLGLGIQPPLPSWGNLASEGMEALNPVVVRWWLIVWPCAGLSVALLALNFVGDGLREAIDPKG